MGRTTTLPQEMEDALIAAEARGEAVCVPMNKAARDLDKENKKNKKGGDVGK
jgi:hypothetical protein